MEIKKRSIVLAALAPLIAISGANAAMDEMEKPEMRVWSAALGEPDEEGMGAALQIVASQSAQGSNGLVVESVSIITTKTGEDEDGNMMTEVAGSVDCAGPFMVEGGAFTVEAAMMEEEGAEKAESAEAEEEGCAFAVAGEASHTYRAWHSWDLSGTVTMGEASMDFDIADQAPAMILEEPEGEAEGSESS
jgi:hypothetical protein